MSIRTTRVPAPLEPLFEQAEKMMTDLFSKVELRPEHGDIRVSGTRYVLVGSDTFSSELHEELRKAFGDAGARQIRYRIARALGRRDAQIIHSKLGVTDPTLKLALGPVHFAHVGWSFVEILEDSAPGPDENCFIHYLHPYSFESADWVESGRKAEQPVCVMNAGYSSGWVQESFGVELKGEELSCRAMGAEHCRFIMAHPSKFDARLEEYRARYAAG
ncbi:MAG: XylR N-terminal domain-containing protein [Myxococcales bacterium]|nr:XylR N-terminal domain-containing protein [Myxococcales bacterium]